MKKSSKVKMDDWVKYDPNGKIKQMADMICKSGLDKCCDVAPNTASNVASIFDWIVSNMRYNHIRALTVKPGYRPNIERILETRNGICVDIAALMVAMLRSINIKCKLLFGDVRVGHADVYHAWVGVLVSGKWVYYDPTYKITGAKGSNYRIKSEH